MNVKIKLKEGAIMPQYAKSGDAGMDLTAIDYDVLRGVITYYTGVHVEIPDGYVGLLFPRSSVYKKDLILSNSVGVIDSGYRGEITFKYKIFDLNKSLFDIREIYAVGERVGQLIIMPYPKIEFQQVDELSNSERGANGYGSTGN